MTLKQERFVSLDVFRGLTVCFMIIVNSPGSGASGYAPLDHAEWFGFTPTDLVFPSFLFAVGNALSFSAGRYGSNAAFLQKVFKRTIIIFLLGYLMYWFPFFHREDGSWVFNDIGHTRIMGVLQRIALCYCIGALLTHYLSGKWVAIISVFLLLAYWAILYLFGIPGLELDMSMNTGTQFDLWVLGSDHLYHDKGGPVAFDPEGLLSTLPAIVNVTAGYLAGAYIQRRGKNYETIAGLLMMGVVLIFVALFWAQFFPLAKKLWTSTFVLLTVGIDLALLSLIIHAIEIKGWKFGARFFLVFGKNSLIIYLLSELLLITIMLVWVHPQLSFYNWINQVFFQAVFPGPFGVLLFALCFMLLCWMAGYWMDRKKIYVRV